MARLVLLPSLADPPGALVPYAVGACVQQLPAIGRCLRAPTLDRRERIAVVGLDAFKLRVARLVDVITEFGSPPLGALLDNPVRKSDRRGQAGERRRTIFRHCRQGGELHTDVGWELALRLHIHPALGAFLVVVVAGQRVVDQRPDTQNRANRPGRCARGVDPSVIDGELVARHRLQVLSRGWWRCGHRNGHRGDVTHRQHLVGGATQCGMPGREEGRTVLASDIGIGGDLQHLRQLQHRLQGRWEHHQRRIAAEFGEPAARLDIPQPEVQPHIGARHDGSPTKRSTPSLVRT